MELSKEHKRLPFFSAKLYNMNMKNKHIDIDIALTHYLVAMLWTESCDMDGNEHLDKNYTIDDIHEELKESSRQDLAKFIAENEADLLTWDGQTTTASEQTGHDFWLTRNSHGCGFWESEWRNVGQKLTEATRKFPEVTAMLFDNKVVMA